MIINSKKSDTREMEWNCQKSITDRRIRNPQQIKHLKEITESIILKLRSSIVKSNNAK